MTIRRIGDVALALALLVLCLPTMVLASFAVCLELSQSPFERVEHVSCNGRRVRLWRFRTLRQTRFGGQLTQTGRVLRGLHIDQLPQLFNVVRGEVPLFAANDGPAVPVRKSLVLRGP